MRLQPLAILLARVVKPFPSVAFSWTKMSKLIDERMRIGTKILIMSITGYLKIGI
jgi:hypothetical protein